MSPPPWCFNSYCAFGRAKIKQIIFLYLRIEFGWVEQEGACLTSRPEGCQQNPRITKVCKEFLQP